MKITVDIDIDELANESCYNEMSIKEAFANELKRSVVADLKGQCTDAVMKQIKQPLEEKMQTAVDSIAQTILESDFKTKEFKFNVDYRSFEGTIEQFIIKKLDTDANKLIVQTVQESAKNLVSELKARYDMTFAAMIVNNMREQKLLADDRLAELLNNTNKHNQQ